MNRLSCEVTTCMHYDKNLCALDKIVVEGPSANHKEETCCMSFTEKQSSGQNFAGMPNNAKPEVGIACVAKHCFYNKSEKCEADAVQVANCHPNASAKSDTHCATFKMG